MTTLDAPRSATGTPGDPGQLVWALMLAGRLVTMDVDRLTAAHTRWSANTGSVLFCVGQLGEAPVGALAARCGLRDSTVTGVLDKLAAQGLVRRTTDPADRRRVTVALTDAGRERLRALAPVLAHGHEQALSPLDAEQQRQLLSLLLTLVRARVPEAL